MYDLCDEAVLALTPKSEQAATESTPPASAEFRHLAVSRSAGVTHVRFKGKREFSEEASDDLRSDFALLAERLDRDSKILLDFTGVSLFASGHAEAIALRNQRLRMKGSRIVLCCLAPAVRDSFFPTSSHQKN